MGVNKNVTGANCIRALARGQIWKMKRVQIRIVDLGKRLVYFRLVRRMGQVRRIHTVAFDRMEQFLKTHRARLAPAEASKRANFPRNASRA
jgi:hypothetical protein